MSQVGSLQSLSIDMIKNERKEVKRKHDNDLQIAINDNKREYEEKLEETTEIEELRRKLQKAIENEKQAKKRLKKDEKAKEILIRDTFKESERKRLEEFDVDEVIKVISESSSSWLTCKNCYMPFDKNIKNPLKCEQLQPNLDQCPYREEDRACGCDLTRCKRCNTPTCSKCANLHQLLCVCRCGNWLSEGMSDRGDMPIPDSKPKPASCRRLLPVWYEKPGIFSDVEKFKVNHHETGETTCEMCDVVFCYDCYDIHSELIGDSEGKCFKQPNGRFLSEITAVKRSLPSYKSQQLESLKGCLEDDYDSSHQSEDNDDDNNDDDDDDDDDDHNN